jgi:hypothetical protein
MATYEPPQLHKSLAQTLLLHMREECFQVMLGHHLLSLALKGQAPRIEGNPTGLV